MKNRLQPGKKHSTMGADQIKKGASTMDVKDFGFEMIHIGINCADDKEAFETAGLIRDLFGFPTRETPLAIFVNEQFEVMKRPNRGEKGHVAIGTTDIEGAMAYLQGKGIGFDESSKGYTEDGKLRIVYFDKDIAGFRFHLTRKG